MAANVKKSGWGPKGWTLLAVFGFLVWAAPVLPTVAAKAPKPDLDHESDDPGRREEWFRMGRQSPDRLPAAEHYFRARTQARKIPSITATAHRPALEGLFSPANITQGNCDWTEIGPAPLVWHDANAIGMVDNGKASGRVNCLAVDTQNDPSGNTVYMGAAYGGVWMSQNGLSTSTTSPPVFTAISDPKQSLAVGSIALDSSTNPPALYVGTGEANFKITNQAHQGFSFKGDSYYGVGIFKTTNNGSSWTLSSTATAGANTVSLKGLSFAKLLVDPVNPQIVLAGAVNGTGNCCADGLSPIPGIYRSADGGNSWTLMSPAAFAGSNFSCTDLAYDASTATYYAAFNAAGVFQSTDQGATWTPLPSPFGGGTVPTDGNNFLRCNLAAANGVLYAFLVNLGGVLSTPAAGDTGLAQFMGGAWSPIGITGLTASLCEPSNHCFYDAYITVIPGGGLAVGGIDVFTTTAVNASSTWTDLINAYSTPKAHADQHALFPVSATTWYAANDGGIYSTTTSGSSWNNLNSSIGTIQFASVSPSRATAGTYLGGAQDNGTSSTTSPFRWDMVFGGDGGYTDTNPDNPNEYFLEPEDTELIRLVGLTSSPQLVVDNTTILDESSFIEPYKVLGGNPASVILGVTRVWKGFSDGTGWAPISPPLVPTNTLGDFIQALDAAPSNPNVIFATTTQFSGGVGSFGVQTTANGGGSWSDVTAGLPSGRPFNCVAVDPTNPSLVYLAVQGFGTGHVFQSANGGGTWTDITGNLPDAPTNWILIDPANPSDVYVATDVGVFVTQNGGAHWDQFGNTLPDAAVLQIKMSTTTPRVIVAATHGRGAWTICPLSAAAVATATPTPTSTPTLTPTPTPCVASIASPNLDLKIKRIQCSPNQVVYRVFVQNNSPNPVKLSDLTVKLWAFDTGITNWQLGSYFSGLLFGNGVNGITANGGFVLNAKPFTPACTSDPTHEANWEFDVTHSSTMSIPANGGYFIAGDFGIFPAGFNPNFNPGLSSWFSQAPGGACGDTGSSNDPSTYMDDPHYALFFQGQLVAEKGETDLNTGTIPCTLICAPGVVPQGTATPTPTISPTPTPCNATPAIVSPNLDLKVRMIQCNTDDQAVFRIFVRNSDPLVQVRVSDLTLKIWAYDTTATGWSLNSYFNGNLFPASGNPSTAAGSPFMLSAQAIPLCNLNPGHFANWELDITNNSSQVIPTNGGYFIDGDFGIQRSDKGAFVPGISQWYSQIPAGEGSSCSDTGGNNPGGYFDDSFYALFYHGQLVAERAGTDPNTGLRPCFCGAPRGIAAADQSLVDLLSAPNATVSPTPMPVRNLSVSAAPNVSKDGEPIRFLVNLDHPSQVRLSLFTLTGEQVYSATTSGGAGENALVWNLENQAGSMVANGLYLYEVEINDGSGDIRKIGKLAVIR